MSEQFREIVGWPAYWVSEAGRIWSTRNKIFLKQSINSMGYPVVTLVDGKRRTTIPVHRLVAEAFLGIPEGMVVCHDDGDPTNNKLSNLRVDTMKSNSKDMVRHKTAPRSKKLTKDQILSIKADTRVHQVIADEYGISNAYVCLLKNGKRGNYTLEVS